MNAFEKAGGQSEVEYNYPIYIPDMFHKPFTDLQICTSCKYFELACLNVRSIHINCTLF